MTSLKHLWNKKKLALKYGKYNGELDEIIEQKIREEIQN